MIERLGTLLEPEKGMDRKKAFAVTLGILTGICGCATVFKGSNQTVSFESEPSGAKVRVGEYSGVTPYTIKMPKGKDYAIEYSKPGYASTTRVLEKDFDWVSAINILFWPGFIVDLATGAMFKYDPGVYSVDLEPIQGNSTERE